MNKNTEQVIRHIADEVKRLAQIILSDDKIGANKKTGKNTLRDSSLYDNVRVEIQNTEQSVVIQALFDNHIDYIEQGRKPRSGKQPPIDALRDWALSRGIPTDNSTLFLISRAIWRDGYQPRPILATLEEEIERRFENEWSDLLMDAITEELITYFS